MNILSMIQKIKSDGFTKEVKGSYSKDELLAVCKILDELDEKGYSDTLNAIWAEDFEKKPVSIDEFLQDDYYLGKVGHDIFPTWRKELQHVLSPVNSVVEWVIEGSIGSGKTFSAVVATLYRIYYLTCLRNPQKFHGLAEGSSIIFGLFNIYKYLAQATSYQYLITWLRDMSPYFKVLRVVDPRRSSKQESDKQVLHLPNNIGIALGSTAINALGMNIFGGVLDEAEFGRNTSITSRDKSQIADLYYNVRARMDSRFMQKGGSNPGLLCLVSSARDTDQFLAKHVTAKRDDPHTHISSYALYEVKDHIYKDSPRFSVVVGDKLHRSFILDDEEKGTQPPEGSKVIKVPVEFLSNFRYNIDDALRDISGIKTYGKKLFFPRRDLLLEAIERSTPRRHPFKQEEVVLSIDDDICIEDYFLKDEIIDLFDPINRLYRPRFHPFADRYVHVDLARNKDCAGIAMTCISEIKNIVRYNTEGLPTNSKDYVHFLDLMIRIRAARGSEIDFAKIRRFVFFLIDTCKFNIVRVSYDGYQGVDSIQIFKKENISAVEFSIDKTVGPYCTLKSIITEGRLDSYYYDPFFEEFTQLEDHTSDDSNHRPEIDHPKGGSKDVSDTVCGSVSGALLTKGRQITGSDMSSRIDRVNRYVEDIKTKSKKDMSNTDWVSSGYSVRNKLEDLFSGK